MAFKEPGKPLELAVPVFLPTFGNHAARRIRHDDLVRPIRRRPQHPDGVIVGQDHVADRLVGHLPHFLDHLGGEARRCLRLDDHHAVVADDDARVRVAFGGECPKVPTNLREADGLFRQIAL